VKGTRGSRRRSRRVEIGRLSQQVKAERVQCQCYVRVHEYLEPLFEHGRRNLN
jgi:hypothetical protein